jgi:uncharacterized protein involved in type VI secretion and phage assembly
MSGDPIERALGHIVHRLDRHHYGKYRGIVADNDDPEQLGRVKVQVPSVLGEEVLGWALPCAAYGGDGNVGALFVPEIGAGVWVEFEEGCLECPIWVGTFWSKPDGASELPKSNDAEGAEVDALPSPPTRKVIKTRKGHTIQFEDKDGEESVLIVHRLGDEQRNVIALTASGLTLLQRIDAGKENRIELTETGITLTDLTGNQLVLGDSAVTLTAKVAFTLDAAGQAVTIKASSIDLESA